MTPIAEQLALISAARDAALGRRWDHARQIAQQALDRQPVCLVALRIQAWSQLELDQDATTDTFEQCSVFDPEDPFSYVGQALWLERHGDRVAALRMWQRAWELDPDNQRIRRAIVSLGGELEDSSLAEGISLLQEHHYASAADALRRVSADRPPDTAALLALATALWHLGGKQQVYNLATTVLLAHPHCVKAMVYLVACEDSSKRTLRTRELIARAEEVDPGFALYRGVALEIGIAPVLERHGVLLTTAVLAS